MTAMLGSPGFGGVAELRPRDLWCVGPRHFTYFARRLVDFVGIEPGDRNLDVATGTGAVLLAAAERCADGLQVVGIDLTPAMLERAAREVRRKRPKARLCVMDTERLAFRSHSFDAGLCSFAFLSIPDKQRALAEFCRVLGPVGALGGQCTTENDSSMLGAMVQDAGYMSVQLSEDAYELVFTDADGWWRWAWCHGSRRLFVMVPATRQAELKDRLFRGLAQYRGDDGLIHGTLRAVLTRARSSAAR
ncbi:MAG: methyltransferase domain-containing protein [Chloroflexi bacterium]|nr:methyltransferase domain-containing protein [Chloroflexota bacterium]